MTLAIHEVIVRDYSKGDPLTFSIYDYDAWSAPDLLGTVTMDSIRFFL